MSLHVTWYADYSLKTYIDVHWCTKCLMFNNIENWYIVLELILYSRYNYTVYKTKMVWMTIPRTSKKNFGKFKTEK